MKAPDQYQSMQTALSAIAPSLSEDSGALACDAIENLLKSKQRRNE